jgi:transcriptional regulator with XRE-family HTH domain
MPVPKSTEANVHFTPEQRAAHKAIRDRFRQEQPGPDELIERGEIDEPVPHGQFMELLNLVSQIRNERERKGLSLTDVSEASGLTRPAISRIENGWNANPTLDTLFRYAAAVGLDISLSAVEASPMAEPEPARTYARPLSVHTRRLRPAEGKTAPPSGSEG